MGLLLGGVGQADLRGHLVGWSHEPSALDAAVDVAEGDVDGGVQGGWFMAPTDELPPQVRLTYTL